MWIVGGLSQPHMTDDNERMFLFGSPGIRAMSKICSGIMQITLKIKSMSTVNSTSPTLSLLTGGKHSP